MNVRFGIIGCGLIGAKRAAALAPGSVVAVCDVDPARAQRLASLYGAQAVSAEALVSHPAVDAVIVATTNVQLAPMAALAVRHGKPVLVEKPAAVNLAEAVELLALSRKHQVPVRVGFNHRYHPALRRAHALVAGGEVGPLMFVRARYGHGGRVGYEKEWRADPTLSGGGELIDQGVHLIDLAGSFLGEFTTVAGTAATFFWKMPVDDNAFMHLTTAGGQVAWLHASCTEWKNTFSLEVYGRDAKLHIEGLGGSYGVERLAFYKMLPEMGPPQTTIYEYPGDDSSWRHELGEFCEDVTRQRTPVPGLVEAVAALQVVDQIYAQSRLNAPPKGPGKQP